MKNDACDCLFFALESGAVSLQEEPAPRVLFLHAEDHSGLKTLKSADLYQPSYYMAGALQASDFEGFSEIGDIKGPYNICLILPPKDMVYTQFLLAKALTLVGADGAVMMAAKNDAGGKRLEKLAKSFGLEGVQSLSKFKARAVWAGAQEYDRQKCQDILERGALQMKDHGYISQPGLYGWDKIDRGSQLLVESLPSDLKGVGADFGCGYGYLSDQILKKHVGVEMLYSVEDDARAIAAARENLALYAGRYELLWRDIRRAEAKLPALDFVIMNPPFHQGKAADISLGQAFIERAAVSLKPGGNLWMVANTHLPYEAVLRQNFSSFQEICKDQGFKILQAVR